MLHRYRRDAGRVGALARRAPALALALAALLALPAAASASPTIEVGLTFPASITVGETASASLLITNDSTFEDPSFTLCDSGEGGPCAGSDGVVLTPSCAQLLGGGGTIACAPGGAQPGVLRVHESATGGAGTQCAGRAFLVTTIDAQLGTLRIAPTGGQSTVLTIGERCRIDFTFTAAAAPALDGSEQPGSQTLPVAHVDARTYLGQPLAGGGSAILSVGPAAPGAPTVAAVIPDRVANDNLPEIRGVAAAGTMVTLYAGAGCGGAALATGSAATYAASGLTVAVADNTVTTFTATATDPASGLTSRCSASAGTYVEDSAAPETMIIRGPGGSGDDDAPVASFASTDPGAAFSCRLNGGSFARCISPQQLPILARGANTFEVRATDAAGNTDATPAVSAFTVGSSSRLASPASCGLNGTAIAGTAYNDTLVGTAARDVLLGMASSDVLRGLGGRDCLYGLGGTDRLDGGPGDDRLFGGAGSDRLVDGRGRDAFSGGAANDRIDARDASRLDRRKRDEVRCGAGVDSVTADRRDRVAGDCEHVTRRSSY